MGIMQQMNMKADGRLRQAIYGVLEKLRGCQLLVNGSTHIRYPLVPPIANTDFYGLEPQALNYLSDKGIIKEADERVIVEIGEPGSSSYRAHESLTFDILRPLDEYHSLLIQEDIGSQPSQFTFWASTGQLTSRNEDGKILFCTFNPKTNPYTLIVRLLRAMGIVVSYDQCGEVLNEIKGATKQEAPDNKTRATDTIKIIRKKLKSQGFPDKLANGFFETDNGLRVAVPFTIVPD